MVFTHFTYLRDENLGVLGLLSQQLRILVLKYVEPELWEIRIKLEFTNLIRT